MIEYIEQFKTSMLNAGLKPPAEIIDDGKIHRFSSNGKAKDAAGWYVLHAGRIPAGCFGDWRKSVVSSWCAKDKHQMDPRERVDQMRLVAHAREQRNNLRAEQHRHAMSKAQYLWDTSRRASINHPYLRGKQIPPFQARQRGDDLVLPIVNFENAIQSLQFINPIGDKRLLLNGAKSGRFILVNGCLDSKGILICEGFATGATLALDYPDKCVIAAIDAGNLKAVAVEARKRYPNANIWICGDDDRLTEGNPGLTKAREAADASGANLIIPEWPFDAPMALSDFNDLMCWRASRGAA
jgi:putative DNA primase/helicase